MSDTISKEWKIIDLIKWGNDFLEKKGVEDPRLNMELMLCHIFNYERVDLYMKFDQPLKQSELDVLRDFVKRRVTGEPLQYILGRTNFYGLDFIVDKNVLIPRPETEILVDKVIKDFKEEEEISILDIGTGSGCIAVSLAKYLPQAEMFAIDISKAALKVAEKNAVLNKTANVKFFEF